MNDERSTPGAVYAEDFHTRPALLPSVGQSCTSRISVSLML